MTFKGHWMTWRLTEIECIWFPIVTMPLSCIISHMQPHIGPKLWNLYTQPERLQCEVLQKVRYINTLTFTFYLYQPVFNAPVAGDPLEFCRCLVLGKLARGCHMLKKVWYVKPFWYTTTILLQGKSDSYHTPLSIPYYDCMPRLIEIY